MRTKLSAKIEDARFKQWLGNVLRTCKREVSVVAQENFKYVIRDCFSLTPPMAGTSYAKGFSASKRAIKKDTGKAFRALTEKGLAQLAKRNQKLPSGGMSAALKWYRSQLDANKKVHLSGDKRLISKMQLEQLRQHLMNNIGITAAGWVKAARELNVRPAPPDWVTKHTGKNPGSYKFRTSGNSLSIVARNTSKHNRSDYIQSTIYRAFRARTNNIMKNITKALAKGKVDAAAIDWGQKVR